MFTKKKKTNFKTTVLIIWMAHTSKSIFFAQLTANVFNNLNLLLALTFCFILTINIFRDQGIALIFAPSRGKTFHAFSEIARTLFTVLEEEKYDMDVWNIHAKVSIMKAGHCFKVRWSRFVLTKQKVVVPFHEVANEEYKEIRRCGI